MVETTQSARVAAAVDPFHCAGCGRDYAGERKQCDCLTGVGIRRSDRMQIVAEQCRDVTISFDEYNRLASQAEARGREAGIREAAAAVAIHFLAMPLTGQVATFKSAHDAILALITKDQK
jgi:hypothetical protein